MIRTLRLGTLMAVACAFTIRIAAAQNPLTPDQTTSSDPDKMTAITVTGCLQRNTTKPVDPVGTAGTSASTNKIDTTFILTNAKAGTLSPADPIGTPTPDAVLVTSTTRTYRLEAEEKTLAPELGHKVEIAGTVAKRGGSGPDASEPATSIPTEPKLTVISIKMIAVACAP